MSGRRARSRLTSQRFRERVEHALELIQSSSLAEHWAVVVAIRKRAPDEAEQAMRSLLAGTARDTAPAFAPRRRGASERWRPRAADRRPAR